MDYVEGFVKSQVDGDLLLILTNEDLEHALGITSSVLRKRWVLIISLYYLRRRGITSGMLRKRWVLFVNSSADSGKWSILLAPPNEAHISVTQQCSVRS